MLDLSRNRLSRIRNHQFVGLQNLWSLNLSYNSIESIEEETLRPCKTLLFLNVSHNKIRWVCKNTFKNVKTLKTLNISNNKIFYFPEENYKELTDLVYMNVLRQNDGNNRLVIELDWLPNLELLEYSFENFEERENIFKSLVSQYSQILSDNH